jgi:hypothetical protein
VGHVHHKDIKDYPGVTVEYTRTLAAQDAWSHGAGFRSKRTMEAVTFHRTDGEVARSTVGMAQINRKSRMMDDRNPSRAAVWSEAAGDPSPASAPWPR